MDENLAGARQHFIQGLSRISQFWGLPKAMGAIFAVLYLSPEPLSLDDLTREVGVTKGSVSTNVRGLERLGMVHAHVRVGERKDYYAAETDFWRIARGILRERQESEFDRALQSVGESLEMTASARKDGADPDLSAFYEDRLRALQSFFRSLDTLVAVLLGLDELRITALERLLGTNKEH